MVLLLGKNKIEKSPFVLDWACIKSSHVTYCYQSLKSPNVSNCLSACLSLCLYVCMSVCLPVCISVCLSVSISLYLSLSVTFSLSYFLSHTLFLCHFLYLTFSLLRYLSYSLSLSPAGLLGHLLGIQLLHSQWSYVTQRQQHHQTPQARYLLRMLQ